MVDFIKQYWWIFLVILLLGTNAFAFWKMDNTQKILEIKRNSHKEQIEAIQEAHKRELERQKKILENYREQMEEISKKYAEAREELKIKHRQRVKKYKKEFFKTPEKTAERVKEVLGFEEVK